MVILKGFNMNNPVRSAGIKVIHVPCTTIPLKFLTGLNKNTKTNCSTAVAVVGVNRIYSPDCIRCYSCSIPSL